MISLRAVRANLGYGMALFMFFLFGLVLALGLPRCLEAPSAGN